MSISGFAPGKEITVPRGAWPVIAQRRKGTPSRASAMQNARIQFGTARSRAGTSAVFAATGKVKAISNWITPGDVNLVLYQDGDTLKSYRQDTVTSATILTGLTTTRSPVFAPLNVWNYICGYDTSGNGTIQTRVFDGTNADKAFRGAPVVTTWDAVDSGAGQCTAGQHFIGFVYQNRTGYSGIPVTGSSFTISAATNAAPCVLTAVGNNLIDGQTVTIASGTGNTAINGTRIVTNRVGSNFELTDTDGNVINGNGIYTGGGTVTNPMQVTLTAGLRSISVTIDFPAQTDGGAGAGGVQSTLFLIMTRADNPNIQYFIPTDTQSGSVGTQPVPYNTPATLTFVASISDEDMANSLAGDTAQANFNLLAQDAAGNGPFNPNFVVAYGNRMCYGVGTTMYASDINNPQQIAADLNAVRMQNQRKMGAAFQLPGNTNFYITGDQWTGYVTDTGDYPSTWAPPVGVSDILGAPFQNCVCAQTGGNWVWIVTSAGPYLYDGTYGEQPITYLYSGYAPDESPIGWKRVNWNAAYAIQIKDNVKESKLYIAVPLDGATEPNFMFCIDYLQGKTFDTCDISLDVYNPAQFSSIGIVKEIATGTANLWIGPAAAGNVRRVDVATHNDEGLAIDSYWESGLCRGAEFRTSMIRVGAVDIWARGNAPLDVNGNPTFTVTLYSPDHQVSVPFTLLSTQGVPAALVPQPGIGYQSKSDISKIENYSIRVGTNVVDGWWELSMLRPYARADLYNR